MSEHAGIVAVEGVDALLARNDVEAVYIATPTTAKEQITQATIDAGKSDCCQSPLR